MTGRVYRVTHVIDERHLADQRVVGLTFRRMYAEAAKAGVTASQDHRVSMVRTAWGYRYELRWVVR